MKQPEAIAHLEAQLTLLTEHWPRFSEAERRPRPGPGRWSKKEVLGHLIDSAANNHGRFVRAQVAPPPFQLLAYDQDAWVRLGACQQLPSDELFALWTSYNRLLMHLLAQIPEPALATECLTPPQHPRHAKLAPRRLRVAPGAARAADCTRALTNVTAGTKKPFLPKKALL